VSSGRLKLREGNIENHLIYYQRDNKSGPKRSDVILYEATPGSALKKILSEALGVLTVVDKQREIFFLNNVKFHIDTVRNLGTFVEIEAIDKGGNIGIENLRDQCRKYMEWLEVDPANLVSGSYSDLLLIDNPPTRKDEKN
jgi:adenylate cyclase class 2